MTIVEYTRIATVINRLIYKLGGVVSKQSMVASTDLTHIKWMLEQINSDWNYGKANRWLGWCQCVLHISGIIDAEVERNETRDIFKGY